MLRRIQRAAIGAIAGAALLFSAAPARAQNSFVTPGGAQATGAQMMCQNGSAQAVPCSASFPLFVSGSFTGTTSNATDAQATTTTNLAAVAYNYVFNGTTWDRQRGIASNADSVATVTAGLLESGALLFGYNVNGGTWDRVRLDANRNIEVVVNASNDANIGITPIVCGSAVSSCVLKATAGNFYSVYADCTAACWLMMFNSATAPSNGATTAGNASGNMVDCIPIAAGSVGSISNNGMPPDVYSVGMTAAISSTACATLTLSTVGFIKGKVK